MPQPRFAELDYQNTPMGTVSLRRRLLPGTDTEVFEAKLGDDFLMSSLFTAGEVELARKALTEAPDRELHVVVGGLGLGYTAAALLDDNRVTELVVLEALAPVIGWHTEHLVPLGARLTQDRRCRLVEGDFFDLALRGRLGNAGAGGADQTGQVDAIVVDIDHSPRHLLHPRHAAFYSPDGVRRIAQMLHPGGVFALWSNDPPDDEYLQRLREFLPDAHAHLVGFPDASGQREASNTVYVARREPSSG